MRRRMRLRRASLRRAMLAAPVVAVPVLGAGLAQAAGPQSANGGSAKTIKMTVKQRRIAYGQSVSATGQAPSADAGKWVDVEFAAAGSSSWTKVATGKLQSAGRFDLTAHLRHSGRVEVVGAWQSSSPTSGSGSGGTPPTNGPRAGDPTSQPQSVQVKAALHVPWRTIDDLGGHKIQISGQLEPQSAGLHIRLQRRSGGGWQTMARDQTGKSGKFYLRYTPRSHEDHLRVRFVGDRTNAAAHAPAGKVVVFTQSVASWYYDAGNTACGFHATYGVANVSLPCGTKVTFVYHGRSVTATVDDRGPYVSGREWDLSQTTAGALGFDGVDNVWASR